MKFNPYEPYNATSEIDDYDILPIDYDVTNLPRMSRHCHDNDAGLANEDVTPLTGVTRTKVSTMNMKLAVRHACGNHYAL